LSKQPNLPLPRSATAVEALECYEEQNRGTIRFLLQTETDRNRGTTKTKQKWLGEKI